VAADARRSAADGAFLSSRYRGGSGRAAPSDDCNGGYGGGRR